jgi:hypothetical protein
MAYKDFRQGYIECALWLAKDAEGHDAEVCEHEIPAEGIAAIDRETLDFYNAHEAVWTAAGMDDAQAGHDFYLTRNRHGAGFWARGLGEAGRTLTNMAHAYGEFDIYVSETGEVFTYPS